MWHNGNMGGKDLDMGFTKSYTKCADNHGKLEIPVDGGVVLVTGGSAVTPGGTNSLEGIDVFVGLDGMMQKTSRAFPWTPGKEFLYSIRDMYPPHDLPSFKRLLKYLEERLCAGDNVFVGCIGGHGRTGTVLAALYTHMTGDVDSINIVRKQVCKKCVESTQQVNFLHKHFGITKQAPTKNRGTTYKGHGTKNKYVPTSTSNSAFWGDTLKDEPKMTGAYKRNGKRIVSIVHMDNPKGILSQEKD